MQRLFVNVPLVIGALISPPAQATHYLIHVLRMRDGDKILLFNGNDGEWIATLHSEKRKTLSLELCEQTRRQPSPSHLLYCFAPLKQGRMDYMVQKAVEMGVGILQPIITQHTQVQKIGIERMRSNVVEAAEQCGVLNLPECREIIHFNQFLADWESDRHLIFCDEKHEAKNPLSVLKVLKPQPIGVIIGPEGGFSSEERRQLYALPFVTALSLGPRILRADTAAVSVLTLLQATIGDWQ